jgi:hypothetical protein
MIKIKFSLLVYFLFYLDAHAKWHKSLQNIYILNKNIEIKEFVRSRGGWDSNFEKLFFESDSIEDLLGKIKNQKLKIEIGANWFFFLKEIEEYKTRINRSLFELSRRLDDNKETFREIRQHFKIRDINCNVYLLWNTNCGWGRASKFGILLSVGSMPVKDTFKILIHEYVHFILKKKRLHLKMKAQTEEKKVNKIVQRLQIR